MWHHKCRIYIFHILACAVDKKNSNIIDAWVEKNDAKSAAREKGEHQDEYFSKAMALTLQRENKYFSDIMKDRLIFIISQKWCCSLINIGSVISVPMLINIIVGIREYIFKNIINTNWPQDKIGDGINPGIKLANIE